MDSTAELLDDATNSERAAVDPLVSPQEMKGQDEGWSVEERTATQAIVGPRDAEGRVTGLDLATVRATAEEELETRWVSKVTKSPSAASILRN